METRDIMHSQWKQQQQLVITNGNREIRYMGKFNSLLWLTEDNLTVTMKELFSIFSFLTLIVVLSVNI